jgi:hypothetical protein
MQARQAGFRSLLALLALRQAVALPCLQAKLKSGKIKALVAQTMSENFKWCAECTAPKAQSPR